MPQVGKDTFLCFMAEVLYEGGYHCDVWGDVERGFERNKKDVIILAPNIRTPEQLRHIRETVPNSFIIKVGRPAYWKDWEENGHAWLGVANPDYSINNDSTMRVLKFYTKILFNENIK